MNSNESSNLLVLRPGDEASLSSSFSARDVRIFAELTGDINPVHLDDAYAATTIFSRCIVHGKLVEGLISAILGTKLPGPMSIFRHTEATFLAPVYIGDEVMATVCVRGLAPKKDNWVVLDTWARVRGEIVLRGEATIVLPRAKLDFRSS
jgi:acyl dehydratase